MINWKTSYKNEKKKKANYLVSNKINWFNNQCGRLNMTAKDADNLPIKFKTSIRGKYFVLKSYGIPVPSTYNGVWVHLTHKQSLILARELLDYAGK